MREGPDAAAMQQQQQQLAMDSQQAELAGAYDLDALSDPALLKDRTAAYEVCTGDGVEMGLEG